MNEINYNLAKDPPSEFDLMSPEKQNIIVDWINENILPRKTPMLDWTSYGMKHLLERKVKMYIHNGEFKGAMLHCGYEPVNVFDRNWCFRISKRSPAFINR